MGDAEVIGDVLVRQERHRPQVMSALVEKAFDEMLLTRDKLSFQGYGRN